MAFGTGSKVTGAKTGTGRSSAERGTIRAPKRGGVFGASQGTGFSPSKARKGTIRSSNTYKG